MAAQLIDNIIDEGAIKKQLDSLDSQLNKTATTLGTCAVAAKAFSDQFASAKGINDIITLTEKYNQTITITQKAQNDLGNQEKQRADTLLKLQQVQESNAKVELLNAQAVIATQKAQEAATKAEQSRADSSAKQAAQAAKTAAAEQALVTAEDSLISALKQAGISVDKLNVSKSQATSVNKLVTTINNSEKGSHEQLAAQYDLNYKAYNKLSASQRDTAPGIAMQKSLGDQSKALKEMEGPMGNFTRDVGNYKNNILQALGVNQGFIGNLANMAMGTEKTGEAFTKVGVTGIKAFGTAMWDLMKNPIVGTIAAIAVVILLVKAAVDSNGEATEKLNQVLAPFKELLAFILNIVSELVVGVIDLTLGIMSWLNSIMALIPGLDAIAAKNQQAIALERQKQELEERGRQQTVKNARDRLQYDDLMVKSKQKDIYSIQQRLDFLQKADAIELENSQQKTKLSTDNHNLLLAQMDAEGKTYEQLSIDKRKALMDSEAAMYEAEAEYVEKTRRLHTQESTLVLEDQSEYIAGLKSKNDADLEAWKTSQNVSNMTASQKIAFEAEYSKKSLDNQKKLNDQKIADLIANNKRQLHLTIQGEEDKLTVEFDAETAKIKRDVAKFGAEYAETKDEYDARRDLLKKNIADMKELEETKDTNKPDGEKLTAAKHENDIIEDQKKQADQKKIESENALHISILQKQQDAYLAQLKANANYNNMSFEQQQGFDLAYFNQQQANQKKIIALTKEDGAIKTADRNKLKAEAELFAQDQIQKQRQHDEQILSENASLSEAEIKMNQNYGDKSIGYQQSLALRIFEIRAKMETDVADLKFKSNQDATARQIVYDNIAGQRAQLMESQKEALISSGNAKQLASDSDFVVQQKTILDQKYLHGLISEGEYQKELRKIQEDGSDQILNDEIKADQTALLDHTKSDDQLLIIQQNLNRKLEQLNDKHVQLKEQKDKALAAKEIELVKATASAIQTIGDDQFQAQCDQIEALKTKNSDAATAETATITAKYNAGILSKTEADAQSAAIDAQKTARDKQLTAQENEVKTKQAIFDKEAAAFSIVLSTAEAIMKDTAKTGFIASIPIVALDAAIGAVELAAVLAKPLPAYAFGVDDHVGGPAIVGDGNKNELVLTPDGKIIKTPAISTIMNLPEHTKVFPDFDKALQEMAFNASISSMNATAPKIEINAYNDAMMRKYMGSLVSQTERQTGELGRLKSLDKHMENVVSTNLKIVDAIKSNKKNPWVN